MLARIPRANRPVSGGKLDRRSPVEAHRRPGNLGAVSVDDPRTTVEVDDVGRSAVERKSSSCCLTRRLESTVGRSRRRRGRAYVSATTEIRYKYNLLY